MAFEIGDRDPSVTDLPVLLKIRDAVLRNDQVMLGPFDGRRVTYADYTALRLPGEPTIPPDQQLLSDPAS